MKQLKQIQQCVDFFCWKILDDLLAFSGKPANDPFAEEGNEAETGLSGIECWIAGGAVRDYFMGIRQFKTDIDLFFPDETEFLKADIFFIEKGKELRETRNSKSFLYKSNRYDLVKKFFSSPDETIKAFDFTVCCAAVDRKRLYLHDSFFIDLSSRKLVINTLPYPLSTLQRMQKYIRKGFSICNGGILEIANAIRELDQEEMEAKHIESYPDGTKRFVGIDR